MDSPVFTERVHKLHEEQGLGVRHLRRLYETFFHGVLASPELIFITRNTLRDSYFLYESASLGEDFYPLWVVGVVNHDGSFSAGDRGGVESLTADRALDNRQHAAFQGHGNGFADVHPFVGKDTLRFNLFYRIVAHHSHEIERGQSDVQKGAST